MPFLYRSVWLKQLGRDLRYAWRGLWRSPAFVATSVFTLAAGIAVVTVLFTVFNAYVLRPFAVRDPGSLYALRWWSPDHPGDTFTWREYEELRDRHDLFDAAIAEDTRLVTSNGRVLGAVFVSGNYFEALGARMRLGRPLSTLDARAFGGEPVVVLSDHAWTRLFDRDPAAIGRALDINDQRLTVVGILRPEFSGLDDDPRDVWMPLTIHDAVVKQNVRNTRALAITLRLRHDVTPDHAAGALGAFVARAAAASHRDANAGAVRAELISSATPNHLSLDLLAILSPVFAAFGLVLVAACANVSNVMLARATARHREIAVRLSLGASRGRIVRQLMTEGLLIALLAGLVGIALANVMLETGLRLFFASMPASVAAILRVVPLDFDWRVFLFTLIVSALATVMFALLPALQATRLTLTPALRGEASTTWRSATLRQVLVIGQVAVSLVLLVAAATLMRNGTALHAIDLGLTPTGITAITPRVQNDAPPAVAAAATPSTPTNATLLANAAVALSAAARIDQVAAVSVTPLSEVTRQISLTSANTPGKIATPNRFVSGGYFSMLRIPLLRGRVFQPEEDRSEAHVAIVSAGAARMFWPGADPIGQTLRIHPPESRDLDDLPGYSDVVVVGVVNDVVSSVIYEGVDRAQVYLPTSATGPHATALLARARSRQDLGLDTFQTLLRPVHPDPFAFEALPLEERLDMQRYPLRAASFIGSLLGGIALMLSVSGLYGVLTYTLGQRTREIGIRMALGATGTAVVRLVMTQSVRVAGVGAAFGAIVAFAVLRTLAAFVELKATTIVDGVAFALGIALVIAATAGASYVPARRATRVDPAKTLRADG